jgi:hypothetical protein
LASGSIFPKNRSFTAPGSLADVQRLVFAPELAPSYCHLTVKRAVLEISPLAGSLNPLADQFVLSLLAKNAIGQLSKRVGNRLNAEYPLRIVGTAIHRPNAKYEITPGVSQNAEKPARSQPYVMNGMGLFRINPAGD